MAMKPGCSVIIVTYNSARTIANCLSSVLNTLRNQDEVVIIDNHSTDDTAHIVETFAVTSPGKVRILKQRENLGFARACNLGIDNSDKEFIVLLNPDTEVFGDWLGRLTAHFQFYKNTGAVGPLSNYVIRSQNIISFFPGYADYLNNASGLQAALKKQFARRSLPARLLIGFCMALRRDLIERVGGLDESFFLGMEDLEISWRLRENNYLLRIALDVFVNHIGHVSFNSVPKSQTDEHVQKGSDALYEKLQAYYQPEKVPHPEDYFGIGWWQPLLLKTESEQRVFAPKHLQKDYPKLLDKINAAIKAHAGHEALQLLQDAIKSYVNDFLLWYMLGSLYMSLGQLESAEEALKNAWALEFGSNKAQTKLKRLRNRLSRARKVVFNSPNQA